MKAERATPVWHKCCVGLACRLCLKLCRVFESSAGCRAARYYVVNGALTIYVRLCMYLVRVVCLPAGGAAWPSQHCVLSAGLQSQCQRHQHINAGAHANREAKPRSCLHRGKVLRVALLSFCEACVQFGWRAATSGPLFGCRLLAVLTYTTVTYRYVVSVCFRAGVGTVHQPQKLARVRSLRRRR